MEMHQIRYFLAVARMGNFTRAAHDCNVSQPSLSRAIGQLEKEFGGTLFLREPDNIQLTELGQLVEPFLSATLNSAKSARAAASQFKNRKKCQLRVGVMCTIAPEIFTRLLKSMRQNHPEVGITVIDARADDLRKRLIDSKLDAAIYAVPHDNDAEKLHEIALYRERMVVILSRMHGLATRNAVNMADLDGEPYVWRVNCEFNGVVDDVFEARGIENRVVYHSERDDWVQTMVASGLGFGFMPSHCVTHPGIVARPLSDLDLWREIKFHTVRGRPHKTGLGALVREVAAIPWSKVEIAGNGAYLAAS